MRRVLRRADDGRARGRARVARHLRIAPGDAADGQALGRGRLQRARRESVLPPAEGADGTTGRADRDSIVVAHDASAERDDERQPDSKDILKKTFADAKLQAEVEVYKAQHGWCPPDTTVYDRGESERAWGRMLDMFKKALA